MSNELDFSSNTPPPANHGPGLLKPLSLVVLAGATLAAVGAAAWVTLGNRKITPPAADAVIVSAPGTTPSVAKPDSATDERYAQASALASAKAKDAEAAKRARDDELRKANTAERIEARRASPKVVVFKDFVNFPEEYSGQSLRFDDVWLHGDFDRIEGTKELSPGVSSRDGKMVFGRKILKYADGVVFVISEKMGRPMSVEFSTNTKYGVNICCDVEKAGKFYTARIYRVETLAVNGMVKVTYDDK